MATYVECDGGPVTETCLYFCSPGVPAPCEDEHCTCDHHWEPEEKAKEPVSVEAHVRGMSPTMRRLYLLEHGWSKSGNDSNWWCPKYGGPHTLAQAIRIAVAEESR